MLQPRSQRSETSPLVRGLAALALCCALMAAEAQDADERREEGQEALQVFNDLIGGWRGVGQPRRGSNRGAWRENAEWVWDFQQDEVAVNYVVDEGKLARRARVTWNAEDDVLQLDLETPDGSRRTYRGEQDQNRIRFTSLPDDDGETHRMTITKLNDKRSLVLHEKRSSDQATFFRVAEVGYTREGTRLAVPGGGQRECIVTGGAGTIEVTHAGKTYYVCCTGCRQAFEDDPEGIIAEAAARRKKAAEKR